MEDLGLSTAIINSSEPNRVVIETLYSGRLVVELKGVGVIFDGEVKGREGVRPRP